MRKLHRLALTITRLLSCATARGLEITLTPDGIAVAAPAPTGDLLLHYPKLTGEGERQAKVTRLTDREAVLSYSSGTTLVLALAEDGTIHLAPRGPLAAADTGISHSMDLPLDYAAKGVRWRMDDKQPVAFPAEKPADPFLFRGDAKKLRLDVPAGAGVMIGLPYGFQQLQDNREWNARNFQWISHSHVPGDGSYTYSISSAAGGKITIGKAPSLDPYAYVPYPPSEESQWPGKGPIRTFGWQEGIRRGYQARRVEDENAVMFIGDSLTENWRTLKEDFPRIKVANRGVGGDTSRGVLFRFPLEVLAHKPAAVSILAGSNDLTAHGAPEDALSNLAAILRLAREYNPKMPVFLATVAPSSNPDAPLLPGALDQLNAGIRELAEEQKVTLIELHNACLLPDGRQNLALYADDRLHFGPQGYAMWKTLMDLQLVKLTLGGRPAAEAKKIDISTFELVRQDEFEGSVLDAAKWESPRQDRQDASRWHERNVSVGGGVARFDIRLTEDPKFRYESACIRTRRNYDVNQTMFQYTYGYIEARCRLPRHLRSDYWAAFWLMGGDLSGGNDDTRQGTEIDIFESFNQWDAGSMKNTLHWGGYGPKHNSDGASSGPAMEMFDDRFHTFGFFWDKTRYVFYVDGIPTWSTDAVGLGTGDDGKNKSAGTLRQPAYVKFSVEAAPWCGPDYRWEKEMPERDLFEVDYVRAYRPKP